MKINILMFALFFSMQVFAQSNLLQTSFKFDFGDNKNENGFIHVMPSDSYNAQKRYGFDSNSKASLKKYSSKNKQHDNYITSAKPIYFSVKLPEGNYNAKIVLGDKKGESVTTIKAENRRLLSEKTITAKGKFETVECTIHVRDSIIRTTGRSVKLKPREISYLHWDDKLTFEFNNILPKVCSMEITPNTDAITVFLAGNSTVVDQAEEPWASWGQMIPAFFQPKKICIANYAESGETLKAFKGELRLEKIWSMAKPGDYLFIEFTHNDQKPGSNYLEPFTTYKQTLKEWITEARKKNMIPVLVTSMHRRFFDSTNHITNTLGDYPEAMRQTAKEENVTLIDLNSMSKILYEAWGPVESVKAFVQYPANTFPGQTKELKDNTHFNAYGAYELAKCIVKGIKESNLPIKEYLKKDLTAIDPAHPDNVNEWSLPMSSFLSSKKPDGN